MIRRRARLPLLVLGLLAVAPAPAAADTYGRCDPVADASLVAVARTTCAEAESLAFALTGEDADAAPTVASAEGWEALRARTVPRSRPLVHDLVVVRPDGAAVRLRRPGAAPDVDGFAAGRELIFSRSTIVGGRPIPRDAAFCTSAFLVRMRTGKPGGLSAAHCAGERRDGTAQRRNAAVRRPPEPGFVLGRVRRLLSRTAPLDALVLPVPTTRGRSSAPVVDRGLSRPPWRVVGTARSIPGRAVCFTGRTSGIDRCGRLTSPRGFERFARFAGLLVRCTTIPAAQGDSGGPVFTRPTAGGDTRAVGIVTLITGPKRRMCFTPIGPVLDRLGASLIV